MSLFFFFVRTTINLVQPNTNPVLDLYLTFLYTSFDLTFLYALNLTSESLSGLVLAHQRSPDPKKIGVYARRSFKKSESYKRLLL